MAEGSVGLHDTPLGGSLGLVGFLSFYRSEVSLYWSFGVDIRSLLRVRWLFLQIGAPVCACPHNKSPTILRSTSWGS